MHHVDFRHEGEVVGFRGRPHEEDLLAAVNQYTLRELGPDEIATFTLELCHNQVDRHHSRFPEDELEHINRLVLGRPFMERHDLRGSLPRGTFFRSRIERHGERVSVRPDVYVLRTGENAGFILNIEGGVYRETSIGFTFTTPECSVCGKDIRTCGHTPGKQYDGDSCHFIMRGVTDVIEGSVVSSGSQGTRFVSQARLSPSGGPAPAIKLPALWARE